MQPLLYLQTTAKPTFVPPYIRDNRAIHDHSGPVTRRQVITLTNAKPHQAPADPDFCLCLPGAPEKLVPADSGHR